MTGVFERDDGSQDALLAAAFAGYLGGDRLLHAAPDTSEAGSLS